MSSRRSPLIVVMQPAHFSDFIGQTNIRPLDRPRHRTIHVQRPVCAPVMIILEVLGQETPQMSLMQDDHVIQACAAETPDQPLDVRMLSRTPWGPEHFFNAPLLHPLPKRVGIDPVPIAQQIPGASSHERASITC